MIHEAVFRRLLQPVRDAARRWPARTGAATSKVLEEAIELHLSGSAGPAAASRSASAASSPRPASRGRVTT